ncbi:MAG: molybdopterin oxidoreductase family protein [SAR324 cluster bacterium]|nr:molybdopterin oxidoreductase family protein [SAR324 cluster bacterium]
MNLITKIQNLFLQTNGPLTQTLAKKTGPNDLGLVPHQPTQTTSLVCGYCSVGCNLQVHQKADKAINLSPEKTHPVNMGKACPKGWQALAPVVADDRAKYPLVKNEKGQFQQTSWEKALDLFHSKLKGVTGDNGLAQAAFLSTGQITTEEMALLGSLAKFGLGIIQGDGNTRQCMATSAVAYKQSFGFDAPPFSYDDLRESDVLVFIGANPCINHPILWKHVVQNPHNPKIIVLDPRNTKTAQAATKRYPLKAKSDLLLLYGIAKVLVDQNLIDEDYIAKNTKGFSEFKSFLEEIDLAEVAKITGIKKEDILALPLTIAQGKRVSFWWTMGVNQGHQAVLTAQAIINLALMTGNMGRVGTGANSITGQCNAMGSRLFSNTTNLLGGHDFARPDHRKKIAQILKIEESKIPQKASLAYDQILDQIEAGEIKFLWVIATNPFHSWIDPEKLQRMREKLDFLVVQDLYSDTVTALAADLFLPAAGWGEKEGVMINSERRLSKVNPVSNIKVQAKTDFEIFLEIAKKFQLGWVTEAFSNPEQAFATLQKITENQPCDISGIAGYKEIESSGGIQWPKAKGNGEQKRLFEDGKYYHKDQKAAFLFGEPTAPPNQTSDNFPYVLLTGRGSSTQWHTGTRTDRSPILKKISPKEIYVEIPPAQAKELGIIEGDLVQVASPRGAITAMALLTNQVKLGEVFIPMHFAEVNQLLDPVFDVSSRQPSYKYTPVRITAQKSL